MIRTLKDRLYYVKKLWWRGCEQLLVVYVDWFAEGIQYQTQNTKPVLMGTPWLHSFNLHYKSKNISTLE